MKHTRVAMVGQPTQASGRPTGGHDGDARDSALSATEQYRLELVRRGIAPIE